MSMTKQQLAAQIFETMVRQSCTTPQGREIAAAIDAATLERFLRTCANNVAQFTKYDDGGE